MDVAQGKLEPIPPHETDVQNPKFRFGRHWPSGSSKSSGTLFTIWQLSLKAAPGKMGSEAVVGILESSLYHDHLYLNRLCTM